MSIFRTFSATLLVGIAGSLSCTPAVDADLILRGGKIITADDEFSVHSAMAVKDGLILAVGNDEDVAVYGASSTHTVDLGGRAVLPGLIDSHSHAASASIAEFDHTIPTMESIQDVLDYVKSRTEVLEEGQWIRVSQVFLTRLQEQRYPSRRELDGAAPRHAVVFRTGPDASLNTLALKLSGIDENWKVDDGGPGYAEKDPATGRLTGILRSCNRYIRYESPTRNPSDAEHEALLKELLADYNRVGITTAAERDAEASEIALYQRLHESGELTVRAMLSRHLDTIQPLEKIREAIQSVRRSPLYTGDDMLRVAAVKTFLDGGMLTGSAYMRQPWGVSPLYGITDPEYRGLRFIPQEKLVEIIAACMENDVQYTAHSVGDGAVHAFIDACQKLSGRFEIRTKRPVMCHSNFMSEEAVQRAASLGITSDIQPAWLNLDGRTLNNHFGYQRLSWFQPLRAIFDAGGIAGGGSDHMQKIGALRSTNFYDPWTAMWVTLTRNARWLEGPIHGEQAITRQEAIRFYTINNAYLLFKEDTIGSLETGKLADFVVLNNDPLTCPIGGIRDMEVLQTYLGGKLVYEQ